MLKISVTSIMKVNYIPNSSLMRSLLFLFFLLFLLGTTAFFGQSSTIAERLGHPPNTKLLIIHADDLGVSHSENMASIKGLESGLVNSASIMVPCPWFPEIAEYARNNKSADLGLHLTLNSEWKNYKWGPVTSKDSVSSLVNKEGYFYPLVPDLNAHGKPEEVEIELRNQIKKAYRSGIDVTHLDAHMGAAFSTPEYFSVYLKLGREFDLPVLISTRFPLLKDKDFKELFDENTVIIDRTYIAVPAHAKEGPLALYYTKVLNDLEPGLNTILLHLAYDDAEMQGVAIDHPDWGAKWRQEDFDFFTSDECAALLKKNNIILVTWRELRDKIVRAK